MNPFKNPDYIRTKNQFMQKLDVMSRRHMNCLRFGENETEDHIKTKLNVILMAMQNEGCEFLTEVYSSDRKFRADILIFKPFSNGCFAQIIEVALHETQLSIDKKREFWTKHGFYFLVI